MGLRNWRRRDPLHQLPPWRHNHGEHHRRRGGTRHCTDAQGAATYGSDSVSSSVSECTTAGTGVSIHLFFAQAYNASGDPVAATSGNDDWIIALVVVIILVLVLLFFYMRRRGKTSPAAAATQAASAPPGVPPASAPRFCRNCGSPWNRVHRSAPAAESRCRRKRRKPASSKSLTVVQAWINAAIGNDMGTPAAMGRYTKSALGTR